MFTVTTVAGREFKATDKASAKSALAFALRFGKKATVKDEDGVYMVVRVDGKDHWFKATPTTINCDVASENAKMVCACCGCELTSQEVEDSERLDKPVCECCYFEKCWCF